MKLFFALFRKDVLTLRRAPHFLIGVLFFSLLLVVVASFSLRQIGYGPEEMLKMFPGTYWMIVMFASVLAMNHSFAAEREYDVLQRFMTTGVDPLLVFLSKWLVNLCFLWAVQSVVFAAFGILFSLDLANDLLPLTLVCAMGTPGIVALGTLFAGMAAATRGRELLLPILLYPIALPALAGAVGLVQGVLEQHHVPTSSFWFQLVIGYDVIAVTLGGVLFEAVVRE